MPYPKIRVTLSLLLALFSLYGCKKEDTKKFTFINSISTPVHIEVYHTPGDYNAKINPFISQTIPAHDSFTASGEFMQTTESYIDWYSTDYAYTNWGQNPQYGLSGSNTVGIMRGNSAYVIQANVPHTARIVCLNGDQMETRWKAVDAFDINGHDNIWSSLSVWEKNVEFIIRRDMSVTLISKDSLQHDIICNEWTSGINDSDPFQGSFWPQSSTSLLLFSNSSSSDAIDPYKGTVTKDSLILFTGKHHYRMVRK